MLIHVIKISLLVLIIDGFLWQTIASPAISHGNRCKREAVDCPPECVSQVNGSGCYNCHCSVPFYRAPKRYCPKIKCPSDCGLKKNAMDCPTCYCHVNSFYRRSVDILKLRPTAKQSLAIASRMQRQKQLDELTVPKLNAIVH